MGLQSPAAYLGGLKEYCMCPQELRSERRRTQRGRGRDKEGKRRKVQTQVRNCVPRVQQTPPRDSRNTDSRTHPAGPLKVREHEAKGGIWRTAGQRPLLAPSPPKWREGEGPGTQTSQKRQPPSMPTSPAPVPGQRSVGRHRAGPEAAAHRTGRCVTKREDRRTQGPVEERGRWGKAGGRPRNQGVPLSRVRTAEGVRREEGRVRKGTVRPHSAGGGDLSQGWPVTPHVSRQEGGVRDG